MNSATRARLFGYDHAFDQPVTLWITLILVGALLVAPVIIAALALTGRIKDSLRTELWKRYLTWLVLVPLMLVPLLLGAAWTMGAVFILSLLCYQEYARVTGLFRERTISLVVVLGIIAVNFAVVDHWYGFFMALFPLTVATIASLAIMADRPHG